MPYLVDYEQFSKYDLIKTQNYYEHIIMELIVYELVLMFVFLLNFNRYFNNNKFLNLYYLFI